VTLFLTLKRQRLSQYSNSNVLQNYYLPSRLTLPSFSVVFVHGLGGHRVRTWTSEPTKQTPRPTFWPLELLPLKCRTARILSFGYDASFAHFYPLYGPKIIPVGTTIDDHSSTLFQDLIGLRNRTNTVRQCILAARISPLGGLVLIVVAC
jgi:protein SERAC1